MSVPLSDPSSEIPASEISALETPPSDAPLLETREGRVAYLRFNRPDRMNAFNDEVLQLLRVALRRLGRDRSVGCIVITGVGKAFCAGGDMKNLAGKGDWNYEDRLDDLSGKHDVTREIRRAGKAVIAMVNGPAIGAGLAIALACDLRIAGRSARFATAFSKVAFSGDFGTSWLLTSTVGTVKARELYFLNPTLKAEEAAAIGLVNQVVDDEQLAAATRELAERIADGPTIAHGYMKRNLLAAESESLATVLDIEAMHHVRTAQTLDHQEAKDAFAQKRPPRFSGL